MWGNVTYEEKHMDLFAVDESYHLAHCIASDLRMGAGIAVPMQTHFGLREKIKRSGENVQYPTCILTDRVFNLITKRLSRDKPFLISLIVTLKKMKQIALDNDIKQIAMPMIGCGLDRLDWKVVSDKIQSIFADTDIDILVCEWR